MQANDIGLLLNVHSLVVLPSAVVAKARDRELQPASRPLPDYAGLNAPSWADLYNGEAEHAATVH